jgi:TRAP-type C4-dicarboxylate transport system permease small subunit
MTGETAIRHSVGVAERWTAGLVRMSSWLAGSACLGAFGVVCYSVFMRYFWGRPVTWADEVAGYLVVATVMFGVAEAQRRGENIGVDVVNEQSPAWLVRLVGTAGALSVAATAWLLLDEGLEMVEFSRMIGIMSNVLPGLPMWTIQLAVPVGGLLLLLVALVQLLSWSVGRPSIASGETQPGRHE